MQNQSGIPEGVLGESKSPKELHFKSEDLQLNSAY